jgi:serine/threonine protein kinase
MDSASDLGRLASADWERLQDLADRFESAWEQAEAGHDPVDLTEYLPPTGDPLRPMALNELIKTDLEIRWRHGLPATVEQYLARFPEIGGVDSRLLYEEYRVRQRYGDKAPLQEYEKRFPIVFADLQRLVQSEPVPPAAVPTSPPPSLSPKLDNLENRQSLPPGGVYRPVQMIGKGAVGEIWRAEAPGGIEVAIKVVIGTVARDEAKREVEALELIKRLRHVYLLPIHAYWQLDDRLLIVMELADGSLRNRLDEVQQAGQSGVPVEELLGYFREAAEALDYLHRKCVLHRDVKPGNILLIQGHAKVADFGLARVLEQSQRLVTSSSCGTPAYSAPEVFWRGKVGPPSDQYSLAVTYAELRLGHPLFPSRNWYRLMNDHLQRRPDLTPLPELERDVLAKALAKDADQRYGSCGEFARALTTAVARS